MYINWKLGRLCPPSTLTKIFLPMQWLGNWHLSSETSKSCYLCLYLYVTGVALPACSLSARESSGIDLLANLFCNVDTS